MLISAFAAVVMFAAPEAAQSGEAAKMAKPEMKRVCSVVEVSGSNLKKKKCRMEPVKAGDKPGEESAEAPAKPE